MYNFNKQCWLLKRTKEYQIDHKRLSEMNIAKSELIPKIVNHLKKCLYNCNLFNLTILYSC